MNTLVRWSWEAMTVARCGRRKLVVRAPPTLVIRIIGTFAPRLMITREGRPTALTLVPTPTWLGKKSAPRVSRKTLANPLVALTRRRPLRMVVLVMDTFVEFASPPIGPRLDPLPLRIPRLVALS